MEKRPALGKGLSALIPDVPEPPRASSTLETDIDRLAPNDFQPRGHVDDARLQELAQSIKSNGVIQPIVVRKIGDRFQIIAGERRWRAAKLAGLLRVPIEEALAYRRLADDFQLTQEAIAAAVGKDRASIANVVRLLKLPDEVRAEVASGRLSMGHARALLGLPNEQQQRTTARDVIARSLSVRETESLVKKMAEEGPPSAKVSPAPKPTDVHVRAAEEKLKFILGTRVRIIHQGTRGRIEIDFTSEEELIRIFEQLSER
jgi:ParB family chromosome partitioning protein